MGTHNENPFNWPGMSPESGPSPQDEKSSMKRYLFLLITALATFGVGPATAGEIMPAGKSLAEFLDGFNVEKLWLPEKIVNWKTGEILKDPTDDKPHTHCSAFVAAVCLKRDV